MPRVTVNKDSLAVTPLPTPDACAGNRAAGAAARRSADGPTTERTAARCPRPAGSARPANHPRDQDRADRGAVVRQPARPGRHALVLQSPRQPATHQKPQPHRPQPPASPLVGPEGDRRQARQRPQGLQPQRRRGLADRAAGRTGLTSRVEYRSFFGMSQNTVQLMELTCDSTGYQ